MADVTYDAEQMRERFLEAVKPANYCLHEHLLTEDSETDGRSFNATWMCSGELLEVAFWEASGDSLVFCLSKASPDETPEHLINWDGSAGEEPPAEVVEQVRVWLEKWSAVVAERV